jgi:hypothetical protein
MSTTSWNLVWSDRPVEEAALFNPAFCGELIARCVVDYEKTRGSPLPLPLAFVILALTLHAPTRGILPGRSDTTFATWTAERGPMIADLPRRVLALRPITREAILFTSQHGALRVDQAGLSRGPRPLKLSAKRAASTAEAEAARRSAGLIGRWLANQGSTAFVLQTLGVRP